MLLSKLKEFSRVNDELQVLLGKSKAVTLKDYRDHHQIDVSIKGKETEIKSENEEKDFTYEKMHGEIIEVPWGEPLRILLETEDDGDTFGHEICNDNVFEELYGPEKKERYNKPAKKEKAGNSNYGESYREEQEENLYGSNKPERQKKKQKRQPDNYHCEVISLEGKMNAKYQ